MTLTSFGASFMGVSERLTPLGIMGDKMKALPSNLSILV